MHTVSLLPEGGCTIESSDALRRLAAALLYLTAGAGVPGAAGARELGLAETERLVLRANREVQAARRGVEAAGAQILQADVRPNPVLSFNATSISGNPGIGAGAIGSKRIDNVFRLDQTLERGNKRELRVDAAQGLERAARGEAQDVLRRQLLAAGTAYADLQQAQHKAAILAENAQLYGRTLAAAQARLKAGDIAAAEVARVQVDAERAQNEVRVAQAELVRAQFALAFMIGEEATALELRAGDAWPAPTSAPAAHGELQAVVEARPDVAAARARVEAAERLRELARSQRTRDVTVGAQFERYPGSTPVNSIGFGVAVPLFFGNDFSGDIRRAEVERNVALEALERARAAAAVEIRRAESDQRAAAERLARYEGTLLAAAQRSAEAAEFAFGRGATSVLELLDARRTLRAVQLEALAARADHARALHALQSALGAKSAP